MIRFFKTLVAIGLVMVSISFSVPVLAQDYGLSQTADASGLNNYPTSVPEIVGNVIGTALSLIAVIFFALMIFGGFLWMTAHGKEDQEKKALDTIIAATIGIIIILASYAITSFVFKSVGGNNVPTGGSGSGGTAEYYCQFSGKCVKVSGSTCGPDQYGPGFDPGGPAFGSEQACKDAL